MGRMPPSAAPMPAPTKAASESGVSRMRSSPNSASRPLVTAKPAHVLAHQEHARVRGERLADGLLHGLAVRDAHGLAHGVASA
jgi:CBS-domain-containing membrane protein